MFKATGLLSSPLNNPPPSDLDLTDLLSSSRGSPSRHSRSPSRGSPSRYLRSPSYRSPSRYSRLLEGSLPELLLRYNADLEKLYKKFWLGFLFRLLLLLGLLSGCDINLIMLGDFNSNNRFK